MKRKLLQHAPFLASAFLFLFGLAAAVRATCRANAGHFVYTLDDPYIHMAVAKNWVLHGVFGLTPHAFSSSTSSPLWTTLIAGTYRVAGVSDGMPGVWAALFALACLFAANALGLQFGLGSWQRLLVCSAVLFFTPLIPLASTGMEHTAHLFFVLVLLQLTLRAVESTGRRTLAFLCLAGLLATATRYETLFLIAPLALILLLHRGWASAGLLVASALLPVVAYGLCSVAHGSYFLPNSLMLKGNFYHPGSFKEIASMLGYHSIGVLAATPHLFAAVALLLLGLLQFRERKTSRNRIALALLCALMLHLQFAATGWFYRYEAYLVGALMAFAGCLFLKPADPAAPFPVDRRPRLPAVAVLSCACLLLWPLGRRACDSLLELVPASHHIYRQQYQMAQFLKEQYGAGARVAANDVGAISYYADPHLLDLWGLATIEVARAKRSGTYDRAAVSRLLDTSNTDVVMVYTNWFPNQLPDSLVAAGSWTVTDGYWGKTVSFFARTPEGARELEKRLRQYQPKLPASVRVTRVETPDLPGSH